jgi:hypothetical protein
MRARASAAATRSPSVDAPANKASMAQTFSSKRASSKTVPSVAMPVAATTQEVRRAPRNTSIPRANPAGFTLPRGLELWGRRPRNLATLHYPAMLARQIGVGTDGQGSGDASLQWSMIASSTLSTTTTSADCRAPFSLRGARRLCR